LLRLFRARGPLNSDRALRALLKNKTFQAEADRVAQRMTQAVTVANAKSWREAAMKGSNSRRIFEALRRELEGTPVGNEVQRIVRENAQLIQSLPLSVAQTVTEFVSKEQQKGKRSAEIEKELRTRIPQLTASRIRLIARTEVGKAESAVTRARSEDLDIDWFQWLSAEDQRVRPSHKNMDKVLARWIDLPSPELLVGEKNYGKYAPGCTFNCRCVGNPVVSLDEISWPARVYFSDSITRMTRAQFSRQFGLQRAA
jgi:SPP1 gp7 family putative phage head morphogenesis protein